MLLLFLLLILLALILLLIKVVASSNDSFIVFHVSYLTSTYLLMTTFCHHCFSLALMRWWWSIDNPKSYHTRNVRSEAFFGTEISIFWEVSRVLQIIAPRRSNPHLFLKFKIICLFYSAVVQRYVLYGSISLQQHKNLATGSKCMHVLWVHVHLVFFLSFFQNQNY